MKTAGGLCLAGALPSVGAKSIPGVRPVESTPSAASSRWFTEHSENSRSRSAVESVERSLNRIAKYDRVHQAIAWLNPQALEEAKRLETRQQPAALEGLTVLAKSTFDVKSVPTDGSNETWARFFTAPALSDSVSVARIRDAGAVVLGKGAADDFGWGGAGLASATGQVYNPRYADRERVAGGSSGGGAAAIAAGYCDAAFGTDDGGSNRIPAHYCGVVGVKTTFGLVPRTGVIPSWPWIDCHGPLAASALVAARVLAAIAGPDPADGLSLRTPHAIDAFSPSPSLDGARLGLVSAHSRLNTLPAKQAEAFGAGLDRLKAAGATVVAVNPPITMENLDERLRAPKASPFDLSACANALVRYLDRRPEGAEYWLPVLLPAYQRFYSYLPDTPAELLAIAQTPYEESAPGQAYAAQRDALVEELAGYYADFELDAMIWPTLNHLALRPEETWPDTPTPLSFANRLGLPEVSVPIPTGVAGEPLGNISFAGLPFKDFKLLALAHAFETTRDDSVS